MATFHSLTGAHLSTGRPCLDVVELLKNALVRAEQGEIIGLAIAVVDGAGQTMNSYAPGTAESHRMMLAVHSLHHRITKLWYDGAEETTHFDNA